MDAVSELPFESVPIQQREEELEVILLPVVRRGLRRRSETDPFSADAVIHLGLRSGSLIQARANRMDLGCKDEPLE